MRRRIRRFGIFQTAKVVAVLYGLLGLLLSPIFLLVSMIAPETEGASYGWIVAIGMPIVYAVIGFITTAIGCAIYNVLGGLTGGIELEFEDVTS